MKLADNKPFGCSEVVRITLTNYCCKAIKILELRLKEDFDIIVELKA
jgi:hypothetical protein